MTWGTPNPNQVATVVARAKARIFVCSPYVKQYGISLIEEALPQGVQTIEVWTRMDSRDWMTGASDPEGMLDFFERHAGKRKVELYTSNLLHSKILLADGQIAAVGSGNLTRGGWGENIEIVRLVEPPETEEVLRYIQETRPLLSSTSLADFRAFVGRCLAYGDEKEALLDLVREVAPAPPPGPAPLIPLREFIRFCSMHGGFAAEEIIKIHKNLDQTNRQGHIKQGFYGVQRFFQQYPHHLAYVRSQPPATPFEIEDSPIIADWRSFLNSFQDERDPNYDYDIGTLIRILPENLGGIITGGG
ncbi:MAG: phospholipase D-like domain-containing protein, partial [Dehalococcoidia bacterium]